MPRLYVKEDNQDTDEVFITDLKTDEFALGISQINFDGPDMIKIIIRYKGTPGLFELLFINNLLGFNVKS